MEEGSSSKSDDVFISLKLNPQDLIDEVIVTVDNLLLEAFSYYAKEASTLVNADNPQKFEHLNRGVDQIRDTFQMLLDKKLSNWELFCLHRCFNVPEGFTLPNDEEPSGISLTTIDGNSDPDLDAQLNSLRSSITEAGKESALLTRELQELQKQSSVGSQVSQDVNEALQLYEQHSFMFQDLVKTGELLRSKIEQQQKNLMEEDERKEWEAICNPNLDLLMSNMRKDFSDEKLQDLQKFLAHIKDV